MSQVRVNTIVDANSGNTAQINGMTPTAQSLQGFRNRIINGDMRIDQRNAGASVTSGFAVDRFANFLSYTSNLTYQQNAGGVTPPPGFTNYLGVTTGTGRTVGSGDVGILFQAIEGNNIADLGWGTANAQTVTLSFWVRSSLTGTHSGSLLNNGDTRSYVFQFPINSANTWEYKTITIPGDTTGTWIANNGKGVVVAFNSGSGSTALTTAGSWNSAGRYGATGSVQLCATTGATFYITGVQLEAGSVATPFERRPYGTELMLCQRYYEVISNGDISGGAFSAGNLFAGVRFAVEKRAAPTVSSVANGSWVGNGGIGSLNTVAFANIGVRGCNMDSLSFVGTVVLGYAYNFRNFDWRASAEL